MTKSNSNCAIESGRVSWIKSFASAAALVGPIVTKSLKSLLDFGIQYDKMQQDKASKILKMDITTSNGTTFKVQCIPVEDSSDIYNMVFEPKSGPSKTYESVKADKFDDTILKYIQDQLNEDTLRKSEELEGDSVKESYNVRATLKKITTSSDTTINCLSSESNIGLAEGYKMLQDVCMDDSFCESVPETPTTYDICLSGDEYNVQVADTAPNTASTYENLVVAAYSCLLNLQTLHWNVTGPHFMRIHTMLGDYVYKLVQDIDVIAELGLQVSASIQSPVELVKRAINMCPSENVEGPRAIETAISTIKDYVFALEFCYSNVPHQVQSIFDDWINYWTLECDYKLNRML